MVIMCHTGVLWVWCTWLSAVGGMCDTGSVAVMHVALRWREYRGMRCDFTLLDRNGKAGWDLASKLLRPRDQYNR